MNFGIKGPTFERMLIAMLHIVSALLYGLFLVKMLFKYSMCIPSTNEERLHYHSFACYTSDVTLKHSNRPAGSKDELKVYLNGKHKMYDLKTEAFVLPNNVAMHVSPYNLDSICDLEIFR